MTPKTDSSTAAANSERLRNVSLAGTAVGFVGGLACSLAMVFAAVGILGAAAGGGASSMSDMMSNRHAGASTGRNGAWDFLIDHGPTILVVSIALVTVALALRRRPGAAVVAGVVGVVMYWGMYTQSDLTIMYITIAAGLIAWLSLVLAASRPSLSR